MSSTHSHTDRRDSSPQKHAAKAAKCSPVHRSSKKPADTKEKTQDGSASHDHMPSTNGLLGQMDRNCDDSGAARPDREPLMNGEMVEQSLDGVTDVSQSVIETPKKGNERIRKGTEPENGTSMDDGGMDHKVGVCYGLLCIRYFVIFF